MRIFTSIILTLGCFLLVSGSKLDDKLLRALQNIQDPDRDTNPRIGTPLTNLNEKQHRPDNLEQAHISPFLPFHPENKNLEVEITPQDIQLEPQLEAEKEHSDIIIPDTLTQDEIIANIIQLDHGNSKQPQTYELDKDNAERLREVEISRPESTRILNIVRPGGPQLVNPQPPALIDNDEIIEDIQPETMLSDNQVDKSKEYELVHKENKHQIIGDASIKQTLHTATNGRPSGVIHNPVSVQNDALEDDFRNIHQETDIKTINNNLHPEKEINKNKNVTEEAQKCSLRQTMAWEVCNKRMPCSSACKTGDDCTFPYCNSLGLCECREAECSSDRMCYFWRIECHGQFTCRNSKCICE